MTGLFPRPSCLPIFGFCETPCVSSFCLSFELGFCTFLKIIYLFIWLHRVLVVASGTFVAACRIFSCGMQDLLVAACRLLVAARGI